MDVAYDQIQEETLVPDDTISKPNASHDASDSLNTEFREAYKAISATPWGAKLGGFFGSVRKQVSYRESSLRLSIWTQLTMVLLLPGRIIL